MTIKGISRLFAVLAVLSATTAFARGGDSSVGGGGGGAFSVTNWNGVMKVETSGSNNGLVATVLKYYELGGAKCESSKLFKDCELEGVGVNGVMTQLEVDPTSPNYLRFAFDLQPSDVLEFTAGNGLATLNFQGPLAAKLFDILLNSGLKPSMYEPDPSHPENIPGRPRAFREGGLSCDRSGRAAGRVGQGPTCTLLTGKYIPADDTSDDRLGG